MFTCSLSRSGSNGGGKLSGKKAFSSAEEYRPAYKESKHRKLPFQCKSSKYSPKLVILSVYDLPGDIGY